jgi:two-component system sensor kinase FixL
LPPKDKTTHVNASAGDKTLRQAAEARLGHLPDDPHERRAVKMQHELQVYQIELEMQNEELQRTLASLNEAVNKYVDFYDSSPSGYLTLNGDGSITEINFAAARLFGKARSQILNQRLEPFIAPESHTAWRRHFLDARLQDAPFSCEICIRRDDNSNLFVQMDSIRLLKEGNAPVLRIAMTDITRLKRMEQALLESESKQRMLEQKEFVQASLDGFWMVNARNGQILEVNENYCTMVGYTRDEILKMSIGDLDAIEAPEDIQARLSNVMTRGYDRFETRHRHKLGHLVDFEVSVTRSGSHGGVNFAFFHDITERNRYNSLLKQSQLLLNTFIRHAPICIAMFDCDMNYLAVSGRWADQYERGNHNLAGLNYYAVHADLPARWKEVHQCALAGVTLEYSEDMWMQRDGSRQWLRWAALPWLDENKIIGGIIIYAEDISDKKNLELEIAAERKAQDQLQKLQIATQTASAIAHEINQPLISITSYLEAAHLLLHAEHPDISQVCTALAGGEQQALRAGKSIRELLDFLARKEYPVEKVDLNSEVVKAIDVAATDYDRQFHPVLNLEEDIPQVKVNRTHLQKILLNLINNGIDAMQGTGVAAASIIVTVRTHKNGNFAQVTIQDNGPGINVQAIETIFEPFFTTKSNGIGMGLAVSRALVEENGGKLWVEAPEGRGAIFHFTLPFAL